MKTIAVAIKNNFFMMTPTWIETFSPRIPN
jgi:hypothetical protein